MGARPLRRTIQRDVEDPLSEKILFGDLLPGQTVVVDVEGEDDARKLTFTAVDGPDQLEGKPTPAAILAGSTEPTGSEETGSGSDSGSGSGESGSGTGESGAGRHAYRPGT